ncbi:hypothetical protein KUTeg_001475 [Tegillarca granosa]|uniref:Uncharacterized protein n=1 Tax=Tegillarca granosa TaxID=220873 RepID=A0ABQ9FW09_TEGGR|nr:hypothetical protein KUTeg_001475 [Tegillarca granosa]
MPRPKSTSNIESHRLDLPTGGIDPLSSHESLELPTTPKFRKSRFDEDTSMVVNRVPNKSVEDVKHAGEHVQPHFQLPLQLPDVLDNTRQQTWDLGDLNVTSGNSSHSSHTSSCFGVIKDLSVSNIHVDEEDKTKDFQSKNLNLLMHETRHHNNSRGVLAANTPDEDSNAFLFMSPADSDPSGYTDSRNQPPSSRHQAWGGQEQAWGGSEQAWGGHQQSCSDQPKFEDKVESWYNRTDDLHSNLVGSRHDDRCGHPYSSGNDLLQMAENLVQMTSAMQTELTTSSGAVGSKQTDSVKHPPLLQTDNDTYDKRSKISHQQTIGLYPVHGSAGQTDLSDWSFQKVDHTYDQNKETSNIESDPFDNSAQDQTKYDSDIGQHINYTELLSNLCSSGIEAESPDQTSVDDITCSSSNIQDVENEDFTVSNSGALSDSNNTEEDIFTGRGQCDETVGPSQNNVNQGEIEDQVEDNNDDGVSSQDLVFPSSFLQQLTGQFGDLQEDDNPGYFV